MYPGNKPLVLPPPKRLEGVIAAMRKTRKSLRESALALLPIILVIVFFQLLLLRQPIPNLGDNPLMPPE